MCSVFCCVCLVYTVCDVCDVFVCVCGLYVGLVVLVSVWWGGVGVWCMMYRACLCVSVGCVWVLCVFCPVFGRFYVVFFVICLCFFLSFF